MNKTAKMMIASNGRQSAVLLDGVMIGVGVDGVRLIKPGEEGVEVGREQTGPHPRKAEHQRGALSPL